MQTSREQLASGAYTRFSHLPSTPVKQGHSKKPLTESNDATQIKSITHNNRSWQFLILLSIVFFALSAFMVTGKNVFKQENSYPRDLSEQDARLDILETYVSTTYGKIRETLEKLQQEFIANNDTNNKNVEQYDMYVKDLRALITNQSNLVEDRIKSLSESINKTLSTFDALIHGEVRRLEGVIAKTRQQSTGRVVHNDNVSPTIYNWADYRAGAKISKPTDVGVGRSTLGTILSFIHSDYRSAPPEVVLGLRGEVVVPGDCFAVQGSQAHITIELVTPISVDAVGITHILGGPNPDAAPREIVILGKGPDDDDPWVVLDTVEYPKPSATEQQSATTDFKLHENNKFPIKFVQLDIKSNWGHPSWTTVYRVRVLGHIAT